MQKAGTWAIAVALCGAAVCASSPAAAQTAALDPNDDTPKEYPACDTPPDEASMQAAQGAFQAGNASFNEADYSRAIFYWEDAYRRDCTAHAMLKNLARAFELNEQYRRAIHALETYLERKPDSGEDEAIGRRIDNLRQKLEERERLAAIPVAPPPKRQEPKPPPPKPEPQSSQALEFELDEEPEEDDSGRSIVPLVVAGVGGAVGIVGGVQWAVARQDELDAEESCGVGVDRQNCTGDAVNKGNDAIDRQVLWGVVGGAGAVVAVGGLIWYFAQDSGDDEDDSLDEDYSRVSPQLGTSFAGVTFEGSF